MPVIRRPFLLAPGEQLLLSPDSLVTASRFVEFLQLTGMAAEDVIVDPVVTVPLPAHRPGSRFPEVDPALMWLPLFWLPQAIAARLSDDESDVEWGMRIALELQAAGLYSAEEGWADVLALVGLDIENPVDLARVEAWQKGAADETLDDLDLLGSFAGEEEWASAQVDAMLPVFLPAQFALTAQSLLNALDQDPGLLPSVAELGADFLVNDPSDNPDVLHEASEALENGADAGEWAPRVRAALTDTVDRYFEALDALAAIEG